jgi:hypothetical protein
MIIKIELFYQRNKSSTSLNRIDKLNNSSTSLNSFDSDETL